MAKMVTPEMERINAKLKKNKGKKYSFTADAWKRFRRNKTAVLGLIIIGVLVFCAIFAPLICPYDYAQTSTGPANQAPSLAHLFGTDNLGRDLFTRCIYGTRYSLPIGVICMITSFIVGGFLGMVAAYFGGRTDNVVMRVMDVFQAIPGILMAITVLAVLGSGIPQIVIALTVSFMPPMAKTMRAAIFTVSGSEYIEACRSFGASNMRLMFRHMLPNAIGHCTIYAVSVVSAAILSVSGLSYVGLGIMPPTPEWGALLSAGRTFLTSNPYMVAFPGLMIALTLFAFNLFGDGLRDALDPRLK